LFTGYQIRQLNSWIQQHIPKYWISSSTAEFLDSAGYPYNTGYQNKLLNSWIQKDIPTIPDIKINYWILGFSRISLQYWISSSAAKFLDLAEYPNNDKVNPSIWFRTVDNQHTRLTRNTSYNKNLIATRFKTDIRRNFFSVRVVSLWNSLPIEVKESRNVTIFKTKLEELVI
jgi:hypothetical protein